jgi:hypothetical protein
MPPNINKLKKYLLSATGGVRFPSGPCPDFFDFSREAMQGTEWWPMQELMCKVVINQWAKANPGMPTCELTPLEAATLEEMVYNAENPVGERRYRQAVINHDPESKDPLIVMLVIGRGAGKSTMNSVFKGFGVRYLISLGDPHKAFGLAKLKSISLQSFAGKEDQVLKLFEGFKTVIGNVHALKNSYDALQKSVNFGGVIEAKAHTSSASTSRGSDTFIYDQEECAFCGEDTPENDKSFTQVYKAIFPAVKNRFKASGLILLITSAGMKMGRSWKMYQDIKAGRIPNAVLFQLAIWEVNPSFQKKDFDSEYAIDYITAESEQGSQWVDVKHRFLTTDEVNRAIERNREEKDFGDPDKLYHIHLDPSRKHDRYSVTIGHKEIRNGKIVAIIDKIRYFQAYYTDKNGSTVYPKSNQEKQKLILVPVQPQEVYDYLVELIEHRFTVYGVTADQFDSGWIIEELNAQYGLPEQAFAEIMPITRKLNYLANRLIKKLINTDAFKIYPDPIWEAEALHVMRYNKNKPLDTVADDLWGDFDDDTAVDDPNLIYTVEAPRSGGVKTDDGWDGAVFCTYKMMTTPDMTPTDMSVVAFKKDADAKMPEGRKMPEIVDIATRILE